MNGAAGAGGRSGPGGPGGGSTGGGGGSLEPGGTRADAGVTEGGVAVTRADGAAAPRPDAGPVPLPVLMFTVGKEIPLHVKIDGRLKVIEDHDGTLKDLASRPSALETRVGIEVRGRSSSMFPKKSYGIELRDAAGMDLDLPFVGLPSESDFVLHGCYADKTCLRNALAYSVGRDLGRWHPRTRFVEVFIDGAYLGIYVVVEKIKVTKSRVAIPKPAPDAAGDLTGGYIFRKEGEGKGMGRDFVTNEKIVWTYHDPSPTELTAAQKTYLRDHMNALEAVMKATTFANPATGYRAWIDVQSWADFALVQELSNNVDAYRRSAFFYKLPKAAGGLVFAGPFWDFDIAFGNADFRDGWKTDVWQWQIPAAVPINAPFFWAKLWGESGFQREARCRWRDLRRGPLAVATLAARLDGWVKELAQAQPRDQDKWKTIGMKVWPNPPDAIGATYADEVRLLKTWIERRLAWMDANLPGACP